MAEEIYFQELEYLFDKGSATLIDMRTPNEKEKDGIIPKAVLMPSFPALLASFAMDPEEYQKVYCVPKPKCDDLIVFMDEGSNRRATQAYWAARRNGYTKVRVYRDGFEDWLDSGGKFFGGTGEDCD